jgi:hypothetical protein
VSHCVRCVRVCVCARVWCVCVCVRMVEFKRRAVVVMMINSAAISSWIEFTHHSL